jgi:hypothetical protein
MMLLVELACKHTHTQLFPQLALTLAVIAERLMMLLLLLHFVYSDA